MKYSFHKRIIAALPQPMKVAQRRLYWGTGTCVQPVNECSTCVIPRLSLYPLVYTLSLVILSFTSSFKKPYFGAGERRSSQVSLQSSDARAEPHEDKRNSLCYV